MLNLGRVISTSSYRSLFLSASTFKGHSKWQNIKATKGKNDLLRSQKVNQILKRVKTAVKHDGFDLKLNRKLADLQLEYKAAGLPLDTFNNFLARLKSKPEQTFYFDLIGPSGSFFIVETEGDNKSRIQGSLTRNLKKIGSFRFAPDSLRNRFDEKGIVKIDSKTKDDKLVKLEDVEELAIELDCEDVSKVVEEEGEKFEFTTSPNNVTKVESALSDKGFKIEAAETELVAQHAISLSAADSALVEKFYESLQELEEVKQIYDNLQTDEGNAATATG
uniref:Uncharacterized protein n=1 Tax=Panagrolaimus sp. JU765 TaxID=591449 RepID=A0AC34REI8_9BILA